MFTAETTEIAEKNKVLKMISKGLLVIFLPLCVLSDFDFSYFDRIIK